MNDSEFAADKSWHSINMIHLVMWSTSDVPFKDDANFSFISYGGRTGRHSTVCNGHDIHLECDVMHGFKSQNGANDCEG